VNEQTAYFGVRLVHLAAMALWVGGPPIAVFGFKRALAAGPEVARSAVERLIAVTPLFVAAALVTIVSGATLVGLAGGVSRVPVRILVGAVLVVPVFALGGGVVRPALNALRDHLAGGGTAESGDRYVRRFVWAHRAEQALRLAILALMSLRF
jgi:hypothetical protein